MERQPNTQYILSLSYGKDSLACLEACKLLGYPIDRVIHAEVWATDTIPADLPPMVEFKSKADEIIKERYGLVVDHVCATRERERVSYEKQFYTVRHNKAKNIDYIYGFPCVRGQWCTSQLKTDVLNSARETNIRKDILSKTNAKARREISDIRLSNENRSMVQQRSKSKSTDSKCKNFSDSPTAQGADINVVRYLGIAADEPERIERHTKPNIILPLVDIGWNEAYCRQWCEENDLLSPIYTTSARGGCWFCHNQGLDQLRHLRTNYPDLWKLLLQWDTDSPVSFHPDGHTVHDFDRRFFAEDLGLVPRDRKFRWKKLATAFDEYLNELLGCD